MQWLRNSKVKIIIGFLAVSIALSSSTLRANSIQNDEINEVSSLPVPMVGKAEAIKINSIDEMNWYLSQMDEKELAATLKLFRVAQIVKGGYVGDVSMENLMSGAIKGTVSSLGDPYSVYMDPKMYKALMIETKGSFGGVGIILGSKDNVLTVVAPIEGTPSAQAGILSGDQIIKIDGKDANGLAIDEAVNLIRGAEGSSVLLTIGRIGQENKEYHLVRSNIQIKTVSGKMLENNIGYIRLSMFNEHTGDDLSNKLKELEGQGMKKIILDLRNNPGGLLGESIKVANYFVPQGPIVSVEGKDGTKKTSFSTLEEIKYPLVILVNGGSASASEIVAGAVQDTGAGTLIGTKTFGKGSVQTVLSLDDSSAVKLTIAKYLTPSGRSIHGVGIEPDIVVEMSELKEDGHDLQLEKGIEVLSEK
ncbi:S41 family peptidase [Pelosinus sp. sgz500959]|uniref:S41 family peptidase n=1 Tax=Pelosinus sp. sgz500959 TaxID=3242472 RepID=UPI00366D0600